MNNDFEIKITKTKKLLEVNNDMVHNFYYLVHGRIINKEKTKYKKFKFVLVYDVFDVQEYYPEEEKITKDMIREYRNDLIFSYTQYINNYNDTKYFYELCNDTINNYNQIH